MGFIIEIPEKPNIISLTTGVNNAFLKFNRSFNGGLQQFFTIEYRLESQTVWTKVNTITDTFIGTIDVVIKDLNPDALYFFRVYASNDKGKSPFSWTSSRTLRKLYAHIIKQHGFSGR